jgi:cytoskeletal protein RodZ
MRRNSQLNPMRMLAMLAVLWAAGTRLFATENPQRARPAEPATTAVSRTVPVAALAQTAEPGPAAQSPAAREPPSEEPVTNAGDSQSNAKSSDAGEPQDAPAKDSGTSSTADKGGTPQRFVPSEQVRADFDVSFPIDI